MEENKQPTTVAPAQAAETKQAAKSERKTRERSRKKGTDYLNISKILTQNLSLLKMKF